MNENHNEMLYCIPTEEHDAARLKVLLSEHPEIKFVSLVGLDIYGNDTDEKIPIGIFLKDIEAFLAKGVQTDGSSVSLPLIADLSNAKVDLIPDRDVNWYVDYNYSNIDENTGKFTGSLRIPAFLKHNDTKDVGSRVILRDSITVFNEELLKALRENSYIFEYLPIENADEIEEIFSTNATEMEFYVKTPHEQADKERLHTSQELKEQYWKRTIGPVRSAMEAAIEEIRKYGIEVEMGHKEVGGVKPELISGGGFEHIMEQLEIDWKYSTPMQAADNDSMVRYIIKDIFRKYGLDVTFMAKPVESAAGSGKHTHFGLAAKLKDGRIVSLFSPIDPETDYMSPIGYGALMGLLKNYEVVFPFANCTNDAMNRLKPGYEAPVCIVTSMGKDIKTYSRNRTVLVGLIRDNKNPLSTRFELRSPNPKSNTHMVIASGHMAMLDGILSVLQAKKSPEELEAAISKDYGEEVFYLEKNRKYRAENNIFVDYSAKEREKLFGTAPATVWEALNAMEKYPEKTKCLLRGNALEKIDIECFRQAACENWAMELRDRIIYSDLDFIRNCRPCHEAEDINELDKENFEKVIQLKHELAKNTKDRLCLLTQLSMAINRKDYETASNLQNLAAEKMSELDAAYKKYKDNLLMI